MRLLLLASIALVACGGARETDLLGTPPADASTTVDTGILPGDDGGEGVDAAPDDDVVVVIDAGKPDVAEPPYKDPGIWCGQTQCTPSTQYCCNDKDFQQNLTYACQATSTIAGCIGGTKVSCDGAKDCPTSQLCCGGLMNGSYDEVSCKPTCTGVVWGRNQIRFCDPKNPIDECKLQGLTCKPSNSLKGYSVCQ
ncbi:hypothetical protein BH09MYX1_BH09MYX1_51180 [soil metagenome]